MWNRRHVADAGNEEASALQRANRGFSSRARPSDVYLYLPQPVLDALFCGIFRGTLGGKGS